MATITINGALYDVGGPDSNISIQANGKVMVDGVVIAASSEPKIINVEINGDIKSLDIQNCNHTTINGDAAEVNVVNGDIRVAGNVGGDVAAVSGDVSTGNVAGSVSTISGDITQMNTDWHSKTDEPPRIPGVYEVQMNDGGGLIDVIAGKRILAYWDGVDTWSYPWCLSVYETYRSRMMPADRMLVWRGDPLPTETRVVLRIVKGRPPGGGIFDVKMDYTKMELAA